MWRAVRRFPLSVPNGTPSLSAGGETFVPFVFCPRHSGGPVRCFHQSFLPKQQQSQQVDPSCDPNPSRTSASGRGGGTFMKILGSTLLVVALPVGYALYDPNFRKTLEGYLPFMKPVLGALSSSSEKPKASINPSLPSIVRPKEPEKKITPVLPKKTEEVKVDKPAPKVSSPAVIAPAAAAGAGVVSQSRADAEKENKQLQKEITAANSKISDLESKVKTLEEYRTAAEKASESPLITDLVTLLGGRSLTPEERKLVETAVADTTARLETEFDRYIIDLEEEQEWELQLQLKRQIQAHADAIQEAVKRQEADLERHFQSRLERRIEEERQRFNLQVAGALGRVKGIEEALASRAKNDKAAQKASYLWHTSHAFYDAVKYGNPTGKSLEERMAPLGKYVTLAKLFCDSHPFVLSILRAVPEEALVRGVYTEDAVRERFSMMRHAARRVAMIDESHNSLYQYVLSYLQSLLVNERNYDLSHQPEVNLDQLDTFRILGTARKCIQRGDIETAVRFIGQLKGEPRKIAQDWLREARLHLATQQIARLLLAHSSAVGLSTVPVDVRK